MHMLSNYRKMIQNIFGLILKYKSINLNLVLKLIIKSFVEKLAQVKILFVNYCFEQGFCQILDLKNSLNYHQLLLKRFVVDY